jgi:O-antigen/teichoic acid export membrane protein
MAKNESLSEKTGVVVFARIITTVVDMAIAIATLQLLSKSDLAVVGYLLMVHEVARNLATLGFPESVFYYFERVTKNARKAFVMQTTGILLLTGILAGGVILIVAWFAPALLNGWEISSIDTVQGLLPFIALVTVLEVPTWPVTNILLAADKQKQSSWYEMITSALTFACLIGPLALGYSLTVAVSGLVLYGIIRFVGSFIWIMMVLPERLEKDSGIPLKEQFSFSIPLGFSSLVNKINRNIDKFVVSILLTSAAYAEYYVAAQEVPIIRVIPFAVGSVLISRYVSFELESKKDELLDLWYKGIEKVSLLVLPLTIMTIVIAPDLVSLIAESEGTSYANAVIPFQIYNMIILVRVTHYGSILQAFGDTKGVMYLSINLVVANIILSVPLTMWLGITGTALATFIANIYNWYIMLRRIGGHMELPPHKVLPFPYYFSVLGLAAVTGAPVWFSRFYLFGEEQVLLGLAWSTPVYLILFALFGTLTKVIGDDDWKKFRDWISLKFLWS